MNRKRLVNTDNYVFSPNYKKAPVSAEQLRKRGTVNLILSGVWLVAAVLSVVTGSYVFALPGLIGSVYFLIIGLRQRGVITDTPGPKD